MPSLPHTFTYYYFTWSHFVHFYVGFILLVVLLYIVISQRFPFYASTFFLWHAVIHFL